MQLAKIKDEGLATNVLGADGKAIILNSREAHRALSLQAQFNREYRNSLGYDLPITTLTAISKSIVEQKFFTLRPSEYMPVRVGDNAWSDKILTYRSYELAGDFEAGNINTGSNNSRLVEADVGLDALTNPIIDWASQISYSLAELKKAARWNNWDLVSEKERSRKRLWDLGIQKIAFFGSVSNASVMGLLTQSGVNSNTALITTAISNMTATQFAALVKGIIGAYRTNCAYTAMPTHFIMPEQDFRGLAVLIPGSAGTFPMPMGDYLLNAFKMVTQNPNFKILPCAYCDEANNVSITGLNKNRYVLLNYNEDSLRMDIPVDYTNTMQNTLNGYHFQSAAYGEYTGVLAYRPLEMLYFDYAT